MTPRAVPSSWKTWVIPILRPRRPILSDMASGVYSPPAHRCQRVENARRKAVTARGTNRRALRSCLFPFGQRPPERPRPGQRRIDAVDWLRGLAVVLMIQTHLYDAWCNPAAKADRRAYAWTRFIGGIPSRLFLLLVGVSMAIRYE